MLCGGHRWPGCVSVCGCGWVGRSGGKTDASDLLGKTEPESGVATALSPSDKSLPLFWRSCFHLVSFRSVRALKGQGYRSKEVRDSGGT
jgi:hypothetical protein